MSALGFRSYQYHFWNTCSTCLSNLSPDYECMNSALNLVWHSNKLEGTLPSGISQRKTYKVLERLYTNQTEEVRVRPEPGIGVESAENAEENGSTCS